MSATFSLSIDLTQINCGVCGGVYAITETYRQRKKDKGGGWHCPYCETDWGYFGNGTIDILKKEKSEIEKRLAAEQSQHDQTKKALADKQSEVLHVSQIAAMKTRQVEKIKNRVGNGVCPCCKRTFKQLAQHIAHKHPDYVENSSRNLHSRIRSQKP